MRKLVRGTCALFVALAMVCSAAAADLVPGPAYKAPPPTLTPIPSWIGFYLGLNAGGSVGQNATWNTLSGRGRFGQFEVFDMSPAGFVGGGQIGYNWQVNAGWVLGVEADIQG